MEANIWNLLDTKTDSEKRGLEQKVIHMLKLSRELEELGSYILVDSELRRLEKRTAGLKETNRVIQENDSHFLHQQPPNSAPPQQRQQQDRERDQKVFNL